MTNTQARKYLEKMLDLYSSGHSVIMCSHDVHVFETAIKALQRAEEEKGD